jgi:hypothetical protein
MTSSLRTNYVSPEAPLQFVFYAEGELARTRGVPLDKNPYALEDFVAFNEWRSGWHDCDRFIQTMPEPRRKARA